MWEPKRIELEAIPPSAPFAEPWLKQLVTHEYRHAVQYGNLHRRFMKWVGYVVGQQAGLLSSVLLPIWFLEGDAVMNETQMASFGRALQPSFTIEYRAYLTEGTKKFPLDKWFCGSYKNYIPLPVRLSTGRLVARTVRGRYVVAGRGIRFEISLYHFDDEVGAA